MVIGTLIYQRVQAIKYQSAANYSRFYDDILARELYVLAADGVEQSACKVK